MKTSNWCCFPLFLLLFFLSSCRISDVEGTGKSISKWLEHNGGMREESSTEDLRRRTEEILLGDWVLTKEAYEKSVNGRREENVIFHLDSLHYINGLDMRSFRERDGGGDLEMVYVYEYVLNNPGQKESLVRKLFRVSDDGSEIIFSPESRFEHKVKIAKISPDTLVTVRNAVGGEKLYETYIPRRSQHIASLLSSVESTR